MRKVFVLVFIVCAFALNTFAQAESHEYAPIKEEKIDYKNWTYKQMTDDKPIDLRAWTKDKKLALVVYFAPWCHNWRNEAPIVARLYDKYKSYGFDVIAVSEYGTPSDRQMFFHDNPVSYTVVVESEARDDRDKTPHYGYRQLTGDKRKWGSPYNIFLVPKNLKHDGDVLTEKAWVVGGELVEQEAEQFIRKQLGLKDEPPSPAPTAPPVK